MVRKDDFVWLLGSLCQVLHLPFNAGLAAQAFPPPHDVDKLIAAAAALGMRARQVAGSPDATTPLPCVAWLREEAGGDEATARPVIIFRMDGQRVLAFAPGRQEPLLLDKAGFASRCRPGFVLAARAAVAAADESDALPGTRTPFGFRWFLPELARHQAIWRQVFATSLMIQLVGLATPLVTQVVIDRVVVHQTMSTLQVAGFALAMFLVFSALMGWMRQYLVLHTGNRIDAVLGQEVFRHLMRLPLSYFERRSTGTLVARLQGIEHIRQFVAGAAVALLLDCPFLVVFLAVMFWYSWQLTLIALGVMLLVCALSVAVTPLFRERLNRQFLEGARNQAFVTEYIAGMHTVKSLQMEPQLEERYGEQLAHYLAAGFASRQLANTYGTLANALEQAMAIAILLVGAMLVIDGTNTAQAGGATFTVGMLVAFQMFASRMSQPMLRLVGLWQEFQQAALSVRRLGDLMDAPAEHHSLAPRRTDAGRPGGEVELQGLGFRYANDHPWLFQGVNMRFGPGELGLVCGASGCGKSTLAKLMLGHCLPGEGRVLVDGADTRQLAVNELRRVFGVVPQETTLFSGSVHGNLQDANPDAGFDEIVAACRDAGIHDDIERLPQGYQTMVGERGVGLSGGQRQRIAIARALLRRARVLIFDEATSNLDAATADTFAHTVNRLKGRATIVFIAHAVPPALQVDFVYRFADAGGGVQGLA